MTNKIKNGVYLIIDPSMDQQLLLLKLEQALTQEIAAIQIWNHWIETVSKKEIISIICELCTRVNVPVLINNDWQLLKQFPLNGVHFDSLPQNFDTIRKTIGRDFIAGVTVNNDLNTVRSAEAMKLDYISFCSVFPSSTSNSCELVSFDTIRKARTITDMPVFLAGGIRPENLFKLNDLDYNGVAVISGIMSADDPAQSIKNYTQLLKNKKNENQHHS